MSGALAPCITATGSPENVLNFLQIVLWFLYKFANKKQEEIAIEQDWFQMRRSGGAPEATKSQVGLQWPLKMMSLTNIESFDLWSDWWWIDGRRSHTSPSIRNSDRKANRFNGLQKWKLLFLFLESKENIFKENISVSKKNEFCWRHNAVLVTVAEWTRKCFDKICFPLGTMASATITKKLT